MADAAAFFANKKKKKKAFKFNANKIDSSTVTKTVHVDAPALSTTNDTSGTGASSLPSVSNSVTPNVNEANEKWDDEALAAANARKTAVATTSTAELLDMKALDLRGNEQDDIAEKLRIEETRAKLAAAKEGMEREAQRIKESKEKKEQDGATTSKPRFGAAAAGLAATGGKWVPPHMRSGGGLAPMRMGTVSSQKLDTQDENLFPDLAAADAILEQKKEKPAYSVAKKTPVGGGAWGAKLKAKRAPKAPEPEPEKPVEEPKEPEPEKKEEAPAPTPAPEVAAAPKQPLKPKKKKKKKDLSTFKPA